MIAKATSVDGDKEGALGMKRLSFFHLLRGLSPIVVRSDDRSDAIDGDALS